MNSKLRQWLTRIERLPPLLRVIVGILFIAGGVLWFLPVLGIWMMPIGIAILAIDIPWMRPVNRAVLAGIKRLATRMKRSSVGWIQALGHKIHRPRRLRKQRTPSESTNDDQFD